MSRFEKGQTGNASGRPKGKCGKLSNAKLAEELAKGDKTALAVILGIMQDNEDAQMQLRAAIAWMAMSKKMRDFMYNTTQAALFNKQREEEEAKRQGKEVEKKEIKVLSIVKD